MTKRGHEAHELQRVEQLLCVVADSVVRIERKLNVLLRMEVFQMALGQDILDAVAAETTAVDSFIALVQGLIDNGTIPAAVGTQILSNIAANKAKLDAAIVANTPAGPEVPPA